jgi:hypothetical protein
MTLRNRSKTIKTPKRMEDRPEFCHLPWPVSPFQSHYESYSDENQSFFDMAHFGASPGPQIAAQKLWRVSQKVTLIR